MLISDSIERKFTEVYNASEWMISTDTGWEDVIDVKQTVEYEVWELKLTNGLILRCADNHIVFDQYYNEIFVKDLSPYNYIITEYGPVQVEAVTNLNYTELMYDIGVDSDNHRYYSNGILSHNTTCAACYILWFAMFVPDSTILIAAHKGDGAMEIMERIRYGYELCPAYIKAGVTSYNKRSLKFDNRSRIFSETTTETTGRGKSITLLYCLDGESNITIRDKITKIEESISLSALYARMLNVGRVIS